MKPMTDLIELSDHFRRAVQFDNQYAITRLVDASVKFANECTWIDLLYPVDNRVVQDNISRLLISLSGIAEAAKESGLNRIVLPLHAHSPFAAFIQENLLDRYNFGIEMEFRTRDYKKDLSRVGKINSDIRTILDEGIRGLAAISSETKYKWDAELKDMKPA